MSDDFFAEIDREQKKRAEAATAAEEAARAAHPYAASAVQQSADLAREYAAKLANRGITMKVNAASNGVTVSMSYGNNHKRQLVYITTSDSRRLEATSYFPGEDGRVFESTDGSGDRVDGWTIDAYRSRLERMIKDYLFYADRHQGVR